MEIINYAVVCSIRFFQRDNGCYRVLGAKEIQWFGHLQPDMIDVPQTEMAIKYLEFLSKRTWGLKVRDHKAQIYKDCHGCCDTY